MLRRCLTWLRATWVVRVLPLDQNILLHQMVGYAILFFTLVHTAAHIINFGTQRKPDLLMNYEFFQAVLASLRCCKKSKIYVSKLRL